MIPHIFHFILGLTNPPGQQVSPVYDFDFMCYLSIRSKLITYPDYEVWLWNNPKCDLSRNLYYQMLLNKDKEGRIKVKDLNEMPAPSEIDLEKWWVTKARFSLAYLADYYRFMILRMYGGVYSDTDCISINAFNFDEHSTVISQEADNTTEHPLFCELAGIHFFGTERFSSFVENFIEQRYLDINDDLNNVALAYKVALELVQTPVMYADEKPFCTIVPSDYFIPVPIAKIYQQLLFETNKYVWKPFNYELHLYNSACSRNGYKAAHIDESAILNEDTSFSKLARRYL